jgi:Ca-activated chloride channel family protein
MNRYFTLPLAVLAVTALAACQEDGGTATVQTETNFSLAGFHAWPEGQAETADLTSVGRDNLVIVVDRSGSMDGNACQSSNTKSEETIAALKQFIPLIPSDVAVGYVDFGTNVEVTVPLGTNNVPALLAAAEAHRADMDSTDLTEAVRTAHAMLAAQALAQNSTGTYRMVIITDGAADNNSSLRRVLSEVNTTPVEVMTAGFCIGSNHALNQPEDTVYVEANSTEDLVGVLTAAVSGEAQDFTFDFTSAEPATQPVQ